MSQKDRQNQRETINEKERKSGGRNREGEWKHTEDKCGYDKMTTNQHMFSKEDETVKSTLQQLQVIFIQTNYEGLVPLTGVHAHRTFQHL